MERVFSDGAKRGMDFCEELVTEGRLAFFIPLERLGHVGLGFGPDAEAVAHFRREVMRA